MYLRHTKNDLYLIWEQKFFFLLEKKRVLFQDKNVTSFMCINILLVEIKTILVFIFKITTFFRKKVKSSSSRVPDLTLIPKE